MPKQLRSLLIFLLLALGGASFFIWAENQEGEIPSAAEYAPNFWLDSEEKYFPADPLEFYYDENLNELPGGVAVERYDNLSLAEKLNNFTVFYKIDERDSEIIYQYWLFYAFNGGDWNDHYGDWESVFVFVDRGTRNIIRAIGSFHQGGIINNELLGSKSDDAKHVWVYVAKGSHSNCLDYIDDGRCDSAKTNVIEGTVFSMYTSDDPQVFHNSEKYELIPLDDLFAKYGDKYSADRPLISESPDLGFGHFDYKLAVPFAGSYSLEGYLLTSGGAPPENVWNKDEYVNPYAARPLTTEVVVDWVRQQFDKAYNFAGGVIASVADLFDGAFAQLTNFIGLGQAGIGPAISNFVGDNSSNSPLEPQGSQSSTAVDSATGSATESTRGVSRDYALQNMVDQLDDIAEQLDILSQQIAALTGRPAVLGTADEIAKIPAEPDDPAQPVSQLKQPEELEPQRVSAKPKVLAASGSKNPSPKPVYPKILISEIYDSGTDEYVELFNPNSFDIDLTDWYIQKKTKSADGWTSYVPRNLFEGKEIKAKDYFLVARSETFWPGGVDAYTDYSLGADNTLALKNPNGEIADKVGWGEAQDFEGSAQAPQPVSGQSVGRKWNDALQNYLDTDDNSADFELQAPTSNVKNIGLQESQEEDQPESYLKILISELKSEGVTTKDEFIELYNPNSTEVNLAGWSLKKKTSSGNESALVSAAAFSGAIPARGYFLIAPQSNEDGTPNYIGSAEPDMYYSGSTYSFADNNTILLYNPIGDLTDRVGFGVAQDFEISPAFNPTADNSIGRIWDAPAQNYFDRDNNAVDFELQLITPKAPNIGLGSGVGEEEGGPNDNSASSSESSPLESESASEPESESEEPAPEEVAEILPQTVVINEVAWMGTVSSAQDEWLELYNNTGAEIDLTDWRLSAGDGGPNIVFGQLPENATAVTTIIPAGGYYLIERTDDTVTSERAQWFGSLGNGLSNDCEVLSLYDAGGILIDQTACSSWPAGNNDTKQTMERVNPNGPGTDPVNWANNNLFTRNGVDASGRAINGTPGRQNSVSVSETLVNMQIMEQLFSEVDSLIMSPFGSPYFVRGIPVVPSGKELLVNQGVVVKFSESSGPQNMYDVGLDVYGTLRAEGTEEERVIFTSYNPLLSWGQIYFGPGSEVWIDNANFNRGGVMSTAHSISRGPGLIVLDSVAAGEINNSVIEDFSNGALQLENSSILVNSIIVQNGVSGWAVKIIGGNPTVQNSTFREILSGFIIEGGSTAFIYGNQFLNIGFGNPNYMPITVANAWPVFADNMASGNYLNAVKLALAVESGQEGHLTKDLPYVFNFLEVQEGASLIINPGVIMKGFQEAKINIKGVLSARGAEDERIIFTSICDSEYGEGVFADSYYDNCGGDPGVWGGIVFRGSSLGSVVERAILRYGSSDGLAQILGADTEISQTIFQHGSSGSQTVYAENASLVYVHDSTFEDGWVGVYVSGECPRMESLDFIRYTYNIVVRGGGSCAIDFDDSE